MLERRDDGTASSDSSGRGRTRSSSCVSVASASGGDGADRRGVGERCSRERFCIYFDDNEVFGLMARPGGTDALKGDCCVLQLKSPPMSSREGRSAQIHLRTNDTTLTQ